MKKYFFFFSMMFFSFPLFAQNSALLKCNDESCLRQLIPYDMKNPPSFDVCKPLDGRVSKNDFDEDMGLLCRLVISRAKAGSRPKDACLNDSSANPDWEMNLSQPMLLRSYNETLTEPFLKKFNVGELIVGGSYNNSTIHGSYVYDQQTYEKTGMHREVSRATYFCITSNPKHYTPYFSVLKLNKKVAEQTYVSVPPEVNLIYYQFPKLTPAPEALVFTDINKDGKDDLVFIRHDFMRGYSLGYCLYQEGQPSCALAISSDYVKPDQMFLQPKLKLEANKIAIIQFYKDEEKLAEAFYDYSSEDIKLKKTQGIK